MCDCPIPCGFDHCCVSEQSKAWDIEASKGGSKLSGYAPCPKAHPSLLVTAARDGDRDAATRLYGLFKGSSLDHWNGVTRAEAYELQAGDYEAVAQRRNREIVIKERYDRMRPRFDVMLDIELVIGSYPGTIRTFKTLKAAREWAETFPENYAALKQLIDEMNAKYNRTRSSHSLFGDYQVGPSSEVRSITISRMRRGYPWFGANVWIHDKTIWRWESESYKALVARHSIAS